MAEIIRKLKNYRITEITQIYKITFWLTLISALIILTVVIIDNFWII